MSCRLTAASGSPRENRSGTRHAFTQHGKTNPRTMSVSLRRRPFPLLCILLLAAAWLTPRPVTAQNRIYVSSTGSDEVRVYDASSGELEDVLIEARSDRTGPQEVLFGPDGMLYVTFFGGEEDNVIHRYDPASGEYLGPFSSGYDLDAPTKMKIGPDGNFYVSQWGNDRFNVVVFDGQTGEFIREATGDTGRRNVMGLAWDDQDRLYVAHWGDGSNGYVRRISSDGSSTTTVIGTAKLEGPVNIWFNDDGTLNVVDWTRATVEAYDVSTGLAVSTRAMGDGAQSRFEGYTFGPDGLLYVCDRLKGRVNRYDPDSGDFIDTFIDDPGLVNPNSVKFGPAANVANESGTVAAPKQSWLAQNYPNPFNPSTTIRFAAARSSHVMLAVYDLFGREVARLVDGTRPAGEYSVQFDAGDLPSGNYLVRLETGGSVTTRVMTLLR
jgi:WD40 repeat protein